MTSIDIRQEYQKLQELHFDITVQCKVLKEKRSKLDESYKAKDISTVWMMDSWSTAESIETKEDDIFIDWDNQYNADVSVVNLYLKVLSLQLTKIDTIMKKLEQITQKNMLKHCPIEYTVQSFQEWTRTNPKIHALQSEILDLLSLKIKTQKMIYDGKIDRASKLEVNVEKLRSKTYFFIEKNPLVDADFTLYVTRLVSKTSDSFESNKIKQFIRHCWDAYNNDNITDCGTDYQNFTGALAHHILTKYGYMRRSETSKSEVSYDQVLAIIETTLIPEIYHVIFRTELHDAPLSEKIKVLKSVSQEELGIKREFIDDSPVPYQEAIVKLKGMNIVMLPTQKLRTIILSAQKIMKRMSDICAQNDTVSGAGEFMDIWVYIVIQAGIENLLTNIEFLKNYCNPNFMLSETGYYLSSLEIAAMYIKNMDESKYLNNLKAEAEFFILSLPNGNLKKLSENRSSPFRYIKDISIPGYDVQTCCEWITDPTLISEYGFTKSSSNETIELSIYRFKDKLSVLQKLFKKNNLILEETENGFIPRANTKNTDASFFTISSKTFAEEKNSWLTYFTYCSFGLSSNVRDLNSISVNEELEQMKVSFNSEFEAINGFDNLHKAVTKLTDLLIEVNCYSLLFPRTKYYSKYLCDCVKMFQCKENKSNPIYPLREDGICDMATLNRLLKKVSNL